MRQSFARALEPHYDDAVRYCRALCARWSPSEAEDVLQEALIKAMERFDDLREPERFRSWLFTIITRTFHDMLRKPWWKRTLSLEEASFDEPMPNVYDRSGQVEAGLILMKALPVLSDEERELLLLFELGGFGVAELVDMRGYRSASAVKSKLHRARHRLREAIMRDEDKRAAPAAELQ